MQGWIRKNIGEKGWRLRCYWDVGSRHGADFLHLHGLLKSHALLRCLLLFLFILKAWTLQKRDHRIKETFILKVFYVNVSVITKKLNKMIINQATVSFIKVRLPLLAPVHWQGYPQRWPRIHWEVCLVIIRLENCFNCISYCISFNIHSILNFYFNLAIFTRNSI